MSSFKIPSTFVQIDLFCKELGFEEKIAFQIKQILDSNFNLQNSKTGQNKHNPETGQNQHNLEINSQNNSKPEIKNEIKSLNPNIQIVKIDLKKELNLTNEVQTKNLEIDSNIDSKIPQNSQKILENNSRPNLLSNEQKTQIKNIIKKEYSKIVGKNLEEIETELENLKFEIKKQNGKNPNKLETLIQNSQKMLNLDFGNDNLDNSPILPNDMAYVRGQIVAKRALEIAASGGHNVLFLGSPGSGKTLLARAYGGILPSMTEQEILEATQIYSVAGLLAKGEIIHKRPFRAPHHSASHVALVGGGSKIRPGEASLAHRGVLFLDEFPEFGRDSIEALRQPLEDGFVSIARASGSLIFPSKFYLLAAANPTPSGFDPDDPDALNKPQNRAAISRYQARFSGPIMDRIDIHVEVSRPKSEELQSTVLAEKSYQIAKRVQKARDIQTQRFTNYYKDKPNLTSIQSNSEMSLPMIQKFCVLDSNGQKLLSSAIERFKLSARAYMRLLKLSRTIADLNGSQNIQSFHLAESLQYRGRWS